MIREQAQAIKAAILASAPTLRVYDADEVPPITAAADYPYVVLDMSRRQGLDTSRRLDYDTDTYAWRCVTMFVGTTADEARWAEEKVTAALERKRLVVNGQPHNAIRWEGGRGVGRDADLDDFYTGSASWTYTTTADQAVA